MRERAEKLIKEYPDFPKKGITFRDVHPLLADPEARQWVLDQLINQYKDKGL